MKAGGYEETLATIARVYDIGAMYARFTDGEGRYLKRWDGLPRTYEEYVAKLYGEPKRDWMLVLNYGLLGSIIALILALVGLR